MATSTTTKKKIMLLSAAEYSTLSTSRTLTKDGVTYIYSPSDTIYCTPDDTVSQTDLTNGLAAKQDTLVSGTSIKTINSTSLLGSGNIEIGGGDVDTAMSDSSTNAVQNRVIKGYVDTEIDDNIGAAMIQILGGTV